LSFDASALVGGSAPEHACSAEAEARSPLERSGEALGAGAAIFHRSRGSKRPW
jgi:hypothetical protein